MLWHTPSFLPPVSANKTDTADGEIPPHWLLLPEWRHIGEGGPDFVGALRCPKNTVTLRPDGIQAVPAWIADAWAAPSLREWPVLYVAVRVGFKLSDLELLTGTFVPDALGAPTPKAHLDKRTGPSRP